MNPGKLAQARRFYHHVYNGGKLTPEDVSYMVSAIEEAYNNIVISEEEHKQFEALKKIWIHLQAEKTGAFFICGEGGEKDEMGLPEAIFVCPTYGLDGMAMYKKEKDYSSPGW